MTEYTPGEYEQQAGRAVRFADSPKTLDEALTQLHDAHTELMQLREASKGPDEYATWKDAAIDERLKRVQLEKQGKLQQYYKIFNQKTTCDIIKIIESLDQPSSFVIGTIQPEGSCFEVLCCELETNKVALVVFDRGRNFNPNDWPQANSNVIQFCRPLGYPLFALVIDSDNMVVSAHTALRPFAFESDPEGYYNNFEINVMELMDISGEDEAYERLYIVWAYISGYLYGHTGINLEALGAWECVWFLDTMGQFNTTQTEDFVDGEDDETEASDESYAIKA